MKSSKVCSGKCLEQEENRPVAPVDEDPKMQRDLSDSLGETLPSSPFF